MKTKYLRKEIEEAYQKGKNEPPLNHIYLVQEYLEDTWNKSQKYIRG